MASRPSRLGLIVSLASEPFAAADVAPAGIVAFVVDVVVESSEATTAKVGTPTDVKNPASSSSGPVRMRMMSPPSAGEVAMILLDDDVKVGFVCIFSADVVLELLPR